MEESGCADFSFALKQRLAEAETEYNAAIAQAGYTGEYDLAAARRNIIMTKDSGKQEKHRRGKPSAVSLYTENQEMEMRATASSLVPSASVAVMVQDFLPVPTALTVPSELTVATLVLLLDQVTVPV